MANKYVRAGASGTASGDDWTNALTDLPTTMVRGTVYYIAAGTYAKATFTTAVSGTDTITIKRATITDHGTDTGWDNGFDGQVSWPATLTFGSYFVFDGVTGDGLSQDPADYGFRLGTPAEALYFAIHFNGLGVGATYTGTQIKHLYAVAPAGDYNKVAFRCHTQIGQLVDFSATYCLLSGFQNAFEANGGCTGLVFSRNTCVDGFSSPSNHGEQINANGCDIVNPTITYNVFDTCPGTGVICANNSDIDGAVIYSNLFISCSGSNGQITGTSGGVLKNSLIYHNTFHSCTNGAWFAGGTGTQTGNEAKNNLLYNMSGAHTATATYASNAYFDCTNIPADTDTQTGVGNPFVSASDLTLAVQTDAGVDLGATYQTDFAGITRTYWSRGAYEFRLLPPSSLTVTAAGGSVIALGWVDISSDEDGFTVERSLNGTTGWTEIADLPAGSTSYADTGLSSGTTYYYRVAAYNSYGSSAWSDVASAATEATPPLSPGIQLGSNIMLLSF